MNRVRRNEIRNIIEKLRECSDDLSRVKDDEDSSRDNIPESLQGTERYYSSEECSDKIEEAIDNINSASETLEEI